MLIPTNLTCKARAQTGTGPPKYATYWLKTVGKSQKDRYDDTPLGSRGLCTFWSEASALSLGFETLLQTQVMLIYRDPAVIR